MIFIKLNNMGFTPIFNLAFDEGYDAVEMSMSVKLMVYLFDGLFLDAQMSWDSVECFKIGQYLV